jgi:predicted RNA-binding protein with PIN domain
MYLIDGNNLIGHTKAITSRPSAYARQLLVEYVSGFLESTHRKAIIVFDGSSAPLRKTSRVQLLFAGPNSSADELIRRRVESSENRRELCVISSDNAVYGYARTCGVKALKCHEFNRLIREAGGRKIEEDRDLSISNTKEWLRYFGEEE